MTSDYLDDYAEKVSESIAGFISTIIGHATPSGAQSSDYKFSISIHDLADDQLQHVIRRNGKQIGTVRYIDGKIVATCDCRPML